jgi:Ulp1 family protease
MLILNPPKSYYNLDEFVKRIHEQSGKAKKAWSKEDRENERARLVILQLRGFRYNTDAASEDFIVKLSQNFSDLRLDADSVKSPIQGQKTVGLTLMDYERLHKGEWFNDQDIYFWKLWLQHGPTYDRKEIDFYDSVQFDNYSLNLKETRNDKVRNNLTPFDKKMVLIPLNLSGPHWNLAVLLNLDTIEKEGVGGPKDVKSPMPCMLVLDSLLLNTTTGVHEHKSIVDWLQRLEPTLNITQATFPLFLPPVLAQDDQSSCGPHTILNALGMIRLHKQAFTYEYAGVNLKGQPLTERFKPFEKMVKKSLEFSYSIHHVDRILGEMRCIVKELSTKQREAIVLS